MYLRWLSKILLAGSTGGRYRNCVESQEPCRPSSVAFLLDFSSTATIDRENVCMAMVLMETFYMEYTPTRRIEFATDDIVSLLSIEDNSDIHRATPSQTRTIMHKEGNIKLLPINASHFPRKATTALCTVRRAERKNVVHPYLEQNCFDYDSKDSCRRRLMDYRNSSRDFHQERRK